MKKLFVTSLLMLLFIGASTAIFADSKKSVIIENKGQWDKEVQFLVKSNGMNAWITSSGVVYDFYKIEKENSSRLSKPMNMTAINKTLMPDEIYRRKGHIVKTEIIRDKATNKDQNMFMKGNDEIITRHNYFRGNDSQKWVRSVPTYRELMAYNIYEGIDIRYYFEHEKLRYDYILAPGAEVSAIKFKVEMGDNSHYFSYVNQSGELVMNTSMGKVYHNKLYAYQEFGGKQRAVECKFELKSDGSIGFLTDNYDKTRQLIIDPLVYSTYFGGSDDEYGNIHSLDSEGNIVMTGYAMSNNYPTTSGAYDETYNGGDFDIYVTKMNAAMDEVIFSTFIGGDRWEAGWGIELDADDDIYIIALTNSRNFPTTPGVYKGYYDETWESAIVKLNSTGTELLFSTYFGGSTAGYDSPFDLKVDGEGNVYFCGLTATTDFPTTTGAFQTTFGGVYDAFVSKLSNDGTTLIYSTYLGGNNNDQATKLILDEDNQVTVVGTTYSSNFYFTDDLTQGLGGDGDIFILKLNDDASEVLFSTRAGGSGLDVPFCLSLDSYGNIVLSGYTCSDNLITTENAYDRTFNGSDYQGWAEDAFVMKTNQDASELIFATYLGGSGNEAIYSQTIDDDDIIFITGLTYSNDFPVSDGALIDTYQDGFGDVFISAFSPDGSDLLYSSYLGGTGMEESYCISLDDLNNVLITGSTTSSDFPVTDDAYNDTYGGGDWIGFDNFITKLDVLTAYTSHAVYLVDKYFDFSTKRKCGGGIVIGYNIAAKGICWNTGGNPTIEDSFTDEGSGDDDFTSLLTNLTPSTLYYYRAYATNQNGTVYGAEYTFTTSEAKTPPEALCKDITVELDEDGFASITADDIDDGSTAEAGIKSLELDKYEFDCDDLGEVIVTLTVTDEYDNAATCEATVIVVDNIAPTITVSVSPTTLWPPNNQMKAITATVEVDDNCSGTTYELTSITSNEDISGDVANATYDTDDLSFDLRASRDGNGTGRVYTITYTATDATGNKTTADATVTVPHNQGKLSLVNDVGIINIYPNPAEDVVTIEVEFAEQSELSIRLLNALGVEMFSLIKPGVNSLLEQIDISRFPSGMYIIEIKIGGEILHEKIIKKY